MTTSFAQLLTAAIYQIRASEDKPIAVIQDELGYEIGRQGGSAIEYWRKGNVPSQLDQIVALGNVLAERANLDEAWKTSFLKAAGVPVTANAPTPTVARSALPTATPQFVGRADEVALLQTLLTTPEQRLITILGLGGMGKTQLALHTAAEHAVQAHFPDGIHFVSLETAGADLWGTLQNSLVPSASAQASPQTIVHEALQSSRSLLILDNLETAIDAAKAVITNLLQATTDLVILTTSRLKLGLQQETTFALAGLDVGETSSSEQLFHSAAQKQNPLFAPTDADQAAIAKICTLLAGCPLAIKLAAAWTNVLAPSQIEAQLRDSLALLSTDAADVPARQQSIRNVVGFAWDHLDSSAQMALSQLAVIPHTFNFAAALAITQIAPTALSQLVERALLSVEQGVQGYRYRMHPLVHQFALEQLPDGQRQQLDFAFATYYLTLLEQQDGVIKGADFRTVLAYLREEEPNLNAAHAIAFAADDAKLLSLGMDAGFFMYELSGRYQAGAALFERWYEAYQRVAPDTDWAIAFYGRWGWFLYRLGQHQHARDIFEVCWDFTRQAPHAPGVVLLCNAIACNSFELGDLDRADAVLADALALHQAHPTIALYEAVTHTILIQLRQKQGRFEDGRIATQNAIAAIESSGNLFGLGFVLNNSGNVEFAAGNYEAAEQIYRNGVTFYQNADYALGESLTRANVARCLIQQGDYATAKAFLDQALALILPTYATTQLIKVLMIYAELAITTGNIPTLLPNLLAKVGHVSESDWDSKQLAKQMLADLQAAPVTSAIRTFREYAAEISRALG